MSYNHDTYLLLRNQEVPRKIALALSDDDGLIYGTVQDLIGGGGATYTDYGTKSAGFALDPTKSVSTVILGADVSASVAAADNGSSFSVWVVPNGHTITIDGHATTLSADGLVSVVRTGGTWKVVAPSSGGGGGTTQDTGWRNVTSSFSTYNTGGASVAPAMIRRVGNLVSFYMYGYDFAAGVESDSFLTGFGGDVNGASWPNFSQIVLAGSTGGVSIFQLTATGTLKCKSNGGGEISGQATWFTNDTFPVTLPGTAA